MIFIARSTVRTHTRTLDPLGASEVSDLLSTSKQGGPL